MKIPGLREEFELHGIHWEACRLPLRTPLVTSAGTYEHRDVLLLRAELSVGDDTVHGFGEAAPLPGWSTESLDDCSAYLKALQLGEPLPDQPVPSLLFGIELAILDGLARHRGMPLYRLLADLTDEPTGDEPNIPLQRALGLDTPDATADAARAAVDQGFSCIKLKLAGEPDADAHRVRALREACPDVLLRLDANGAFTGDDAQRFLNDVASFGIDLIEEPVAPDEPETLARLRASTEIPIAADETCSPPARCRSLIEEDAIDALVLKTSSIGGLRATLRLITEARDRGMPVILSTLLDGAIGRHGIAHLAAALPSLPGPHGLATGDLFAADLTPTPDRIAEGALHLHDGPGIGFTPGGPS